MRFAASTLVLALPLLGVAAEGPFDQYKAQFQNILGSVNSFLGNPPSKPEQADAGAAGEAAGAGFAESKVPTSNLEILTLGNWKDKLLGSVKPGATKPEEWWVLITGRNKTCFGHCLQAEAAYNDTAAKFATLPKAPHTAYLNCEDQAVLCNSWSAGPGSLWVIELLPPPAKTDIYFKRLNLTTTTSKTFLDLYALEDKESEFKLYEGYFHPFDGVLATNGLAVPIGYALWAFNILPSWAMMLIVSFVSRNFMGRRMAGNRGAPAAGGAPPGDAAGPR